jgi:hypothetical protein
VLTANINIVRSYLTPDGWADRLLNCRCLFLFWPADNRSWQSLNAGCFFWKVGQLSVADFLWPFSQVFCAERAPGGKSHVDSLPSVHCSLHFHLNLTR